MRTKPKQSALPKSRQKGRKKGGSMTPTRVRNILSWRQKRKSNDQTREK